MPQIKVIEFDTLDSTNSEALRYVESGGNESLVFTSKIQTKGRGQGQNTWHSQSEEGLYYSLLLQNRCYPARPTMADDFILIKSIQNVIEHIAGVTTVFKKPNDIYLDKKKMGGILIETRSPSHHRYMDSVVIGIGLNLNQESFPDHLEHTAISLFQKTGKKYNKYAFIGLITDYIDLLFPPQK